MESLVMTATEDGHEARLHGMFTDGPDYRIDIHTTDTGISLRWVEMEIVIDEKEIPRLTEEPSAITLSSFGIAEGNSFFECLCEAFRHQLGLFEKIAGYALREPTPLFKNPCAVEIYGKHADV